MSEKVPSTLALYRRLAKLSPSGWLFSRALSLRAPYFASIKPLVTQLEPGCCVAEIRHRRRVQNHIGTVHAIALCNLAELSAGLVCEASLPTSMRWIPKGMSVDYLAKANGRMQAEARPAIPAVHAEEGYELPITVSVRDPGGTEVLGATIRMWATPKPRR
jgi:acyl-coenzyme A thioesterase PaaI-like protein